MHGEHHNQQLSSHYTYRMGYHRVEMGAYKIINNKYPFENSLDLKLLYGNITTFLDTW